MSHTNIAFHLILGQQGQIPMRKQTLQANTNMEVRFYQKTHRLSEKYQVTAPEFKELSKLDANLWIREVLNGNSKDEDKFMADVNGVQYGLALKMVYQRWISRKEIPLNDPMIFQEEVLNTYSLFEFK